MSDLIWFVVLAVIFVMSGLVCIEIGWKIWKKQKMDLVISYHCEKVREENKRAYCTLFGIGVLTMGIGFLLSGICAPFLQSLLVFVPMTVGMAAGFALMISAIMKYNR